MSRRRSFLRAVWSVLPSRRIAVVLAVVSSRLPISLGGALLYRWAWRWWGNAFAASPHVVTECRRLLEASDVDAVLELGSGLSSVVLSRVAARRSVSITMLEHEPEWAEVIAPHLSRRGRSALIVAPLAPLGDVDWYGVNPDDVPQGRLLVFCDGPPAATRGGRRGVLQTVVPRCAPGSVLVVDDVNRDVERELLDELQAALGGSVGEHAGDGRNFGVLDTRS